MALTHRQVEGVISLFTTSFINCSNEDERKKMIVNFEDTFGKSIAEWQTKCREAICATTNREDAISIGDLEKMTWYLCICISYKLRINGPQ